MPPATERIIHTMQSRVQGTPKTRRLCRPGRCLLSTRPGDRRRRRLSACGAGAEQITRPEQCGFLRRRRLLHHGRGMHGRTSLQRCHHLCPKALALGSGDLSSFAIVGDANADIGEYERAAVAYSRLDISGESASKPRNVYVRDSRTSYSIHLGDTAGAIRLMQSAVAAGTEARFPRKTWPGSTTNWANTSFRRAICGRRRRLPGRAQYSSRRLSRSGRAGKTSRQPRPLR